jgi:hypothetical protein
MKTSFLVVFFTIIMVSSVNAQSTLALQEKCANGARENFERTFCGNQSLIYQSGCFVTDPFGTFYWWYEHHYNKKLDRCFLLAYGHTGRKGQPKFDDHRLIDVFEGKVNPVATYFTNAVDDKNLLLHPDVLECRVGGKQCKSLEEFQNLIRPYMEE